MADITMCNGDGCPATQAMRCYRYRAKASDMQSWFATPPVQPDGSCDRYMPLIVHPKRDAT